MAKKKHLAGFVEAIGLGALIRIPNPMWSQDRAQYGVTFGGFQFESTEMHEWLQERNVNYRLLAGEDEKEAEDVNAYYLFIADRTQAMAFVVQFGNETEHRTWYDNAPDYSDDGIPIGWEKHD